MVAASPARPHSEREENGSYEYEVAQVVLFQFQVLEFEGEHGNLRYQQRSEMMTSATMA